MVLGQEHVPQAELLGLQFELLEDSGGGIPSLFAFAELRLEDSLGGQAVFLDEFFDLFVDCSLASLIDGSVAS